MTDNTITETAAPMRLRAETPRVTRLSRKMLASVGAAALPDHPAAVCDQFLSTRPHGARLRAAVEHGAR